MTTVGGKNALENELRVGNRCLLHVVGDYFLVEILDVEKTWIRVSFPGKDYPVEGMQVTLDFHDVSGFNSYLSHVIKGPDRRGGLTLARPVDSRRNRHRDSCRVPTDLTVQVKDQVHVRRYDAALIDLSGGGALIETDAPFDFSTTIEMQLSLPGEPRHLVVGQIVHVADTGRHGAPDRRMFGVRFVALAPDVVHSVTAYVWRRLREVYPTT